ncbi:MAG: hypothetical protein KC618_07705 [Candidatus Omnitrophica bacterium]|nr:hypothetical protein [Candidatus Omnitrophota bacterium]
MKKVVIMVLAAMLAASTGFAKTEIIDTEVQQAQKVKKKRYFWTKQLDDLKIVGKVKHIPENNKVIVPYFRVTFATGGKYLNAVGGITTSKTKIYSKLNGVEESIMQDVTNAMYEDLIQQLKDAGYEVLDVSMLDDNATYQKLAESSKFPVVKKNFAQFTPNNRYFPGTVSVKAFMLARDVDALMLKADYTVNFITMARNEQKFNLLKDKSDVAVGQGINVFGELAVITEKGPVAFMIQQPINSAFPIGEVVDATTGMNKVSDGVALVGSLLGGNVGNRQSTSTVEVNAEPEAYKKATADALSKSNGTLVSFMAASIAGEDLNEQDLQAE